MHFYCTCNLIALRFCDNFHHTNKLTHLGIAYEDHGQYQKSYRCFRNNYEVVNQVFGPYHVRSKRALGVLNEPMYKRIATQLNETPPEMPPDV